MLNWIDKKELIVMHAQEIYNILQMDNESNWIKFFSDTIFELASCTDEEKFKVNLAMSQDQGNREVSRSKIEPNHSVAFGRTDKPFGPKRV